MEKVHIRDIEHRVQTGDIVLFYTPFKWWKINRYLPLIIRKVTGVRYNHAGVVVSNWGVNFINEAIGIGVASEVVSHRLVNRNVKILRVVKERRKSEEFTARKANSVLGRTKYDFLGLVYQFIWNVTGKRLWVGPRTREGAMKRFYCYEYAAWVHEHVFRDWWIVDLGLTFEVGTYVVFEGKIIK